MVDISRETADATDARLRRVIRSARLKVYDGRWMFEEFPLAEFALHASVDALALVRDDTVWSQLVPHTGNGEAFKLLRFHFPAGVDNSGFVGWLASLVKQAFGSGVFVTCGSNTADGGIFDYWGVPDAIGEEVADFIAKLAAPESG